MMVSSIADPTGTDVNGESYWDSESAVTVIESVFNGFSGEPDSPVFGCGKTRNCDILSRKEKSWEIWRLETE